MVCPKHGVRYEQSTVNHTMANYGPIVVLVLTVQQVQDSITLHSYIFLAVLRRYYMSENSGCMKRSRKVAAWN